MVVDNAQLTRLRLFRSKEVVRRGIFVFNVTTKQLFNGKVYASIVQEVISFDFNDLFYGRFYTMTFEALSSLDLFKNKLKLKLVLARQVEKHIMSCYIFSSPFEQRALLVLVFDITRVQVFDDQSLGGNLLNLINYCWECYLSVTGNIKTASNMWFAENFYNSLLDEDSKFVEVKPTLKLSYARENVGNDKSDQSMCSICLEKISKKQQTIELIRCGHMFHAQCIFEWLPEKKSCPNCRTSTFTKLFLNGF